MLFQNSTHIPIIFENHAGEDKNGLLHTVRNDEASRHCEGAIRSNQGAPVFVKADGEQLLGVFNNLIKNAIQSIPDEKEGLIKVIIDTDFDKVRVTISDNGKGVPEEFRKKLFTPNFTTKTGGLGLGLAISRRTVESAGGKIWFDSKEGSGSNFYVELYQSSDSDSE
jgi:signal transduction histidine kinase